PGPVLVAPPPLPARRARARAILAAIVILLLLGGLAGWFGRSRVSDGLPPSGAAGVRPVRPRALGERLVLEDGLKWIRALAVAPDGRSVLAGGGLDNDVRLWELPGGRVRLRLVGHTSWIQSVAFSRDGRYALTGSGGSWKLVDGQRPGGADFSVRLWDVARGTLLRTFTGHDEPVTGVAFAPDGRTAASSCRDHTVRLWSLENGTSREFVGPAEFFCVAFTPSGDRVLAGSWEGATLWDVAGVRAAQTLGGHIGPVLAVAVSPDGRQAVTGGDDASIRLWSLDDARSLRVLQGHAGRVNALAWSGDGRHLLSGAADGVLRLWDVDSGQVLAALPSPGTSIDCVAFSPNQRWALAGYHDGTVRVWDLPPIPGGVPGRPR
ncbi:MAG: WD40 repeat domain-containing protein, partial [Isosphaeraceae bacterium]|nr:WD40 repeat domain-containing protein [Isosphaeraceae bacterium]